MDDGQPCIRETLGADGRDGDRPRKIHFLSKQSDPIADMIFVNRIREEAGLPPLGPEAL